MEIFHCFFCPRIVGRKCVNDENLREIRRDNVNCEKWTYSDSADSCNLLVTTLIIALLLIVSGNVTLNPGPMKKFPAKYEKMMPTRSNNCKCGYLLCCVATRVLHFSALIFVYINISHHIPHAFVVFNVIKNKVNSC